MGNWQVVYILRKRPSERPKARVPAVNIFFFNAKTSLVPSLSSRKSKMPGFHKVRWRGAWDTHLAWLLRRVTFTLPRTRFK